jgi:hypothetical protein
MMPTDQLMQMQRQGFLSVLSLADKERDSSHEPKTEFRKSTHEPESWIGRTTFSRRPLDRHED